EDGIRDFHVTGVQTCALRSGFIVPQPSGGECDELHTAFPKTLLRCEQTGFSCRGAVIPLKEEAVDGFSAIPLFGHLGSDPCLRPQMPSLPGGGAISP